MFKYLTTVFAVLFLSVLAAPAIDASDGPENLKNLKDRPPACEGPEQLSCADSRDYCKKPEGMCRVPEHIGECTRPPRDCTGTERALVCGCDGRTYWNECEAASEGINVLFSGDCADGD